MAPIVVIALCQLAVLIGGILSAGVADKIATTFYIAHANDPTREINTFTGGAGFTAGTSLLLDWWMVWVLIPLIWVSIAAWIRTRPHLSDGARGVSIGSGITLIVVFAVWAVVGGVMPMLNAFTRE